MKTVAILAPEHSVLQAIADPQYCFTAVNQFLQVNGKGALFHVQLVGLQPVIKLQNGQYTVRPDRLVSQPFQPDLIIIPALSGDMEKALSANADFLPWLQQQYARGAELASLCLGAFLLAETGLLNGLSCSTHWGFQQEFAQRFPQVKVEEGTVVTEQQGLYSSGGALSYWNLLLHLVEKYTDRATAILASKYFAVDIDRSSQAAFALFQGQKNHQDEVIRRAQELIEQQVEDRLSVEDLADRLALGRRSFERRFRQATGNSVLEYVQRVKVEAAKRQFENSRKNINEVMYEVGYTDTKAFRTVFKKLTGLTPVAYREKYQKQPLMQMAG